MLFFPQPDRISTNIERPYYSSSDKAASLPLRFGEEAANTIIAARQKIPKESATPSTVLVGRAQSQSDHTSLVMTAEEKEEISVHTDTWKMLPMLPETDQFRAEDVRIASAPMVEFEMRITSCLSVRPVESILIAALIIKLVVMAELVWLLLWLRIRKMALGDG